MSSRIKTPPTRGFRLPTIHLAASAKGCLFLAAALAVESYSATIEKTIRNPAELTYAFMAADADPNNLHKLTLEWRRDANGNTIVWEMSQTVTLTKGQVYVWGSQSNNYPERYIFDGKGKVALFAVNAASGYKPKLTLSGITVQNGYNQTYAGGGMWAYGADDIQIYYCKFLNNKSSMNGSGIAILETRNFYMLHTVVDGNWNHQLGKCGGGLTAGGGGVAVLTSATKAWASIHKSTISNNKTCRGGGIEFAGNLDINMTNNTISNNVAERRGGGILCRGGTGSAVQHMRFNTIAYNKAGTATEFTQNERHYGGGVAFWGFKGSLTTKGNVIGGNTVTNNHKSYLGYTGDDCYNDGGTVTASPYTNFLGKNSNCSMFGNAGSWGIGTEASPLDPRLVGLRLGKTNESFAMPVHVPWSDSPLRGNYFATNVSNQCESKDQRGYWRVLYNPRRCDIGSVEYDGAENP